MTADKKSASQSQEHKIPKRSFLKILWASLGFLAMAEIFVVCLSFFLPYKKKSKKASADKIITAGSVDNFKPGSVTAFTRGFFYLVHLNDGGFMAFSSRCTHLGCTLPWDDTAEQFICPCHASKFDIRGLVVNSPAPRPLDILPVKIENRMIQVDIGHKIKRKDFNPGDVVYPDQVKTGGRGT